MSGSIPCWTGMGPMTCVRISVEGTSSADRKRENFDLRTLYAPGPTYPAEGTIEYTAVEGLRGIHLEWVWLWEHSFQGAWLPLVSVGTVGAGLWWEELVPVTTQDAESQVEGWVFEYLCGCGQPRPLHGG